MRRRVLNVLCVLSLLGVVLIAVLWYVGGLQLVQPLGLEVVAHRSHLEINCYSDWPQPPAPAWEWARGRFYYRTMEDATAAWVFNGEGMGLGWGVAGMKFYEGYVTLKPTALAPAGSAARTVGHWIVTLPYLLLVPLLLALPLGVAASWLVRERRRRLTSGETVCLHCGYDLRGTEGGTCPECGGVSGRAS